MGLFNRRNKKKNQDYHISRKNHAVIKTAISDDIDENIKVIKEKLKDCDDIIYREFLVGEKQNFKYALIFTDGLANKDQISDFIMESLMHKAREVVPDPKSFREGLYKLSADGNIAMTEKKEAENIEEAIANILIGETILLIDGFDKILIFGTRGWPIRGISESPTETVTRGPRDGFVETGKVNTTLIRRRIRDPKLKLKYMQIGERSKTDVAIMYMEDIVNEELLAEVKNRLEGIYIDAVLESSYIEQLIEDDWISPFPQLENTERPDQVAAALYEGRVAIIIDNTPFALIAPVTLSILMQSSEDYYDRWVISFIQRTLRYVSLPVALFLPALYIAFTAYHPGIIPSKLALFVAGSRLGVPFPAFVEAFVMEITLELLRESGTRIAGPIGTTIGIVGGLVIGQAAVAASIVSPFIIIVVSATTLSSFALPNTSFAAGIRLMRFIFMGFAAVLGLYGIVLGFLILLSHLAGLKSFGFSYTSPFSSTFKRKDDFKDSFIRVPLRFMKKRPLFISDRNAIRMDNDIKKDEVNDNKGDKNGRK